MKIQEFETSATDKNITRISKQLGFDDYKNTSIKQKRQILDAAKDEYLNGKMSLDDFSYFGDVFHGLMDDDDFNSPEAELFLSVGDLAYHERSFLRNPGDKKNYFFQLCDEVFKN